MRKSADGWINLSASSLSIFDDCPRCGWRWSRGVGRPRGIVPGLPGGIDRAVKGYVDGHRAEGRWPPFFAALPGRPVGTPPRARMSWEDPALRVRVCGYLDDAYEDGAGRVGPVDFKTRGSPPKEVLGVYIRQMNVYALLLRANGHTPTGDACLAYVYPTGGDFASGIPFGVTIKRLATSEEAAKAAIARAVEIIRNPPPPPSATCEHCAWLESASRLDQQTEVTA